MPQTKYSCNFDQFFYVALSFFQNLNILCWNNILNESILINNLCFSPTLIIRFSFYLKKEKEFKKLPDEKIYVIQYITVFKKIRGLENKKYSHVAFRKS